MKKCGYTIGAIKEEGVDYCDSAIREESVSDKPTREQIVSLNRYLKGPFPEQFDNGCVHDGHRIPSLSESRHRASIRIHSGYGKANESHPRNSHRGSQVDLPGVQHSSYRCRGTSCGPDKSCREA